jgi:hypothetical protein
MASPMPILRRTSSCAATVAGTGAMNTVVNVLIVAEGARRHGDS